MVERIEEKLGHPDRCPHGWPIDTVFEQFRRDAARVHELGLQLLWTLETHVHADHVTGAWLLKQRDGKGGFERKRRALLATMKRGGAS